MPDPASSTFSPSGDFALVYEELKRIARAQLRRYGSHSWMGTTTLVHETWLKVLRPEEYGFTNAAQFFCLASRAMRSVVIDEARRWLAIKRGGGLTPVSYVSDVVGRESDVLAIVAAHEALEQLESHHPRAAQVLELHEFGGLDLAEIATLLELSYTSVKRDLSIARRWVAEWKDGNG